MTLGEPEKQLLRRYPKAIAHMRWQLDAKRFGLLFGAGASLSLGFPSWETLVQRVVESPEVDGATLTTEVRKPLPIIAEVAYHAFRQRHIEDVRAISSNANDVERLLTARWIDLIHRCLYCGVPESDAELLAHDTVYKHLLPVVKMAFITVNYNYDDSLQRLLLYTRHEIDEGRGFETIVDPNLQHNHANAVLYHPNGFLPRNHLERTTDKIIFNDGTFADQITDFMAGTFSSMLHHLSQHTWLLVGLSLSDETLRHMLHKNALLNPGHYHYHVEHCSTAVEKLSSAMNGQAAANFETYNLITLFLGSAEIAALGNCLAAPHDDLRALAEEIGVRLSYTFYLAGVPGVGKSTSLSHFKNCATWDEWLEERLPEMGKPFVSLTEEERNKVDAWIMKQVGLKNRRLLDAERNNGIGITVVDRCVPDAVTFTQPAGWRDKAKSLLDAVSPGNANRIVHPGHVILLVGDPKEIKIRAAVKNKDTPEKYTEGMQRALELVYGEDGVSKLDATNMTVRQVVKEIARIIHLADYHACNLQKRLEDIRDGVITNNEAIELA
jgi:SIR2-like domain